jgi:hypothetical protein
VEEFDIFVFLGDDLAEFWLTGEDGCKIFVQDVQQFIDQQLRYSPPKLMIETKSEPFLISTIRNIVSSFFSWIIEWFDVLLVGLPAKTTIAKVPTVDNIQQEVGTSKNLFNIVVDIASKQIKLYIKQVLFQALWPKFQIIVLLQLFLCAQLGLLYLLLDPVKHEIYL